MAGTQRVRTASGIISPRSPAGLPRTAASDQEQSDRELEARRLALLHDLHVLDTEPEPAFDELVFLAAQIAEVPTALVSLMDSERQWFKARTGLDVCTTGRDVAFCDHVVRNRAELEVPDLRLDPRFVANPTVIGPPHARFYAGFPLIMEDGLIPGTLCVIGYRPKRLSEVQKRMLRALAEQVTTQLTLRRRNEQQAREIEHRRDVEAQLGASRRRYQLLADHSLDVIARYRVDGTITYVSPSVVNVLGHQVADVLGASANGFVHADQQPLFAAARAAAVAGGTTTLTVQVQCADGSWRWLELTVAPIRDDAGELEILSSARDVNERVRVTHELARSEQRFRSVYQDSPVGIILADENGLIIEANPAMCRLLGREEGEVVGRRPDSFGPADGEPGPADWYRRHDVVESTLEMERRFVRGDGEVRWSHIAVAAVHGPQGRLWSVAHVQDVTDRRAAERDLADSEATLAAISRVVRQMHTGEDPRQSIVDAVRDIGGADTSSLVEIHPEDPTVLTVTASSGAEYPDVRLPLDAVLATTHVWRTAEAMFTPEAAAHPLVNVELLSGTGAHSMLWQPVVAHGQVVALLIGSWDERRVQMPERAVRAVTLLADEAAVALEHHALLRRYAELAVTDALTGLPNRRAWNDQVDTLFQLARRTGGPLVLAIADVDHFKSFNDSFGHLEGDVLLREIAQCAQAQLREVDIVSRWGGEEFAIALPGCTAADALIVLDRIRTTIPRGQTVSFGLAEWSPGSDAQSLLAAADDALYQSKKDGRNRITAAG